MNLHLGAQDMTSGAWPAFGSGSCRAGRSDRVARDFRRAASPSSTSRIALFGPGMDQSFFKGAVTRAHLAPRAPSRFIDVAAALAGRSSQRKGRREDV
ncbi:MAG TPA: hypothetical protein VFA87_11835 [Rhizomicrobium sp.]|nr:hypothetical protein [Rhizomicrobium sp.]